MASHPQQLRSWHRALAYAITGEQWDGLAEQSAPDLEELAALIEARCPGGLPRLRETVVRRRSAGAPWPYPVPAELRAGLGAAQWLAALTALRRLLGLDPAAARPVLSSRAPDADERRLLADVPPHHGH